MHRKFVDEHTLLIPPRTYRSENEIILNFDSSPEQMVAHHYYPVDPEPQIPEGYQISDESVFTFHEIYHEDIVTVVESSESTDPETGEVSSSSTPVEQMVMVDDSYIEADWQYEQIPEAPFPERDAAEKQIVGLIFNLAAKYNAVEAVAGLQAIDIPSLMALVQQYQVDPTDMQALMTTISIYVLQLQAVTEGTWSEAWDGLKSRFARWFGEIAAENQQQAE